jgi:hypothetical protein
VDYSNLVTPPYVALFYDWLTELRELFVDLEYPHSGGSGKNYFVRSLSDIRNLLSQQAHPEIVITIFGIRIFSLRSRDHALLLALALEQLPEDEYFQIVETKPFPHEIVALADGKGHAELRQYFAALDAQQEVAVGVHPFDIPKEKWQQTYGMEVKYVSISVRKSLNWYTPYIEDPARYADAMAQWEAA